jgi:hypothetical protein
MERPESNTTLVTYLLNVLAAAQEVRASACCYAELLNKNEIISSSKQACISKYRHCENSGKFKT